MFEERNDTIGEAITSQHQDTAIDAASKMEEAVYTHVEPQTKKKKNKGNGFRAVVATGLICSLVGGSIGGVIGANLAGSQSSVQLSNNGNSGTVQLVGNQGEISPVIAIAKKVTPSVVGVTVYGTYNYWGRQITNQKLSSGSGIIFREDGYIVTNYHVVENATSVTITLSDGTEYDARIVGSDSSSDLAVLKVDATDLPAATLGDSDELQIGELVVAIGNPLGYENTVTDGIVSGLNRQLTNYTDTMTLIQTNAAINSGNSGGALVNSKGEVVGINSAKLVASNAEGMGFALSINEVKPILEEIINQGHVSRPYLGVTINSQYQVDEATAEKYEIPMGIQIAEVVEGGPAEKAGLRAGDIIYKVDDTLVQSFDDLSDIIENSQVGDQLRVLANRNGEKITAVVTLTEGNA
jgi:serine protease Do